MAATQISADETRGTLTASTNQVTLKSNVDGNGAERDYIEGFLATTHLDKGNDIFTEEALKMMAKDITQAQETVDAVFNDVDTEALKEATTGNLDHNNNPAAPFGDTRIVPAFKVVDAQVRDVPGDTDEKGLWIKAVLNSDGMLPATVSAIKNSIRDGFLDAFSIEFIPEKVKQVRRDKRVVRIIEAAKAKGAALTGRPMNPAAQLTDSLLKSMAVEYEDELKQDYSIQTPEYSATSTASWEKPAESDFPEDYNTPSIFIVRNTESDNFSDQALPVVDWRNGEATLVLEALRSAHRLAPQVEGLSDEEVSRARSTIENLAEEEFDVELGEEGSQKNDSAMTEDDVEEEVVEETKSESEPEEGGEEDVVEDEPVQEEDGASVEDAEPEDEEEEGGEPEPEEGEDASLKSDVEELKSSMQELASTNESLREENEDLKAELEDLRQLQEIKSEVDEVKKVLEDVELEDGPRVRQDTKRFDQEEAESKARWKKTLDRMDNPEAFLEGRGNSKSHIEAFAENHGIDTEEVKNYVNRD